MEQQNSKKLGLINSLVLLVVTIGALILTLQTHSTVSLAGVVLLGIGTLIGFFSFIQSHLIDRERVEALEMQELDRTRGNESLFAGAAEDAYPARNARRQFEKWVVPGFSVLVLVGQALGLLLVYSQLGGWTLSSSTPPSDSAMPIMFFALFMVVLFMMGKYSAGLARMDGQELLRPGANYMLLGSVVCTAVVIAEMASKEYPVWEEVFTWVVFVVIALSALENLGTLVLEIFRPRLDDKKTRLLYDSRLIGLLGQPGGLISTAAHTLDYQFGFKVSETWFYKYLEQKLALIIAIQVVVLFLSSSFVVIQSNEEAVKERFGKQSAKLLAPGFHLKLPWPIDKVYRYPTDEIQEFILGVLEQNDEAEPEVLLWTTPHNHGSSNDREKNFNMIVASSDVLLDSAASDSVPVNLLTVSIPVQYRINNLTNWVYETDNAVSMLRKLSMRAVTRYLIRVDMTKLMGPGRIDAQEELKKAIQREADDRKLGAEIVFVGLQDIHPPVGQNEQSKATGGVAESYEKVNVARLHSETNRLGALQYKAGKVPMARGLAAEIVANASSESTSKVALAKAEAGRFGHQISAFNAAPSVYMTRSKLETFVNATRGARKYILSNTDNRDIINLELQDKLRSDLLDVTIDPEN
jgi:regulator of protease activity HflC (stomatin/prohibitin superfamily)